jgi:hypothetical protein
MHEGLELLRLGSRELAQLGAMGVTTLEQLALANERELGLGKSKGQDVVTRARNILAVRHIQSLSIREDAVEIEVDRPSQGIISAIKGVLGALDDPSWGNCKVAVSTTNLCFQQLQSRPPRSCSYYDPTNYAGCKEASIDRCACHGQYYCLLHFGDHVPSIRQDFARLVDQAKKLREKLNQKKQQDLTEAGITLPEDQVRSFARERKFAGFWQAVFEDIQGQETMKQAITAGLFSPPHDPVHVLVIGEPASAKTLARDILLQTFSGLTPVGANATRAGLVCNRSTGESGALAFSDGKCVLVDEFDKIEPTDLSYCLELLSNGRCDVHSARVHETIESHFTMIGFANPEGDIFSGNPQMDIGLRPTVMSRFALVVKVGTIGREEKLNLFRRSLQGKGELKRLPDYYDQWLRLARLYSPALSVSAERSEHYLQAMVDIVEKYINTPLRRDIRMKDYLRRVPEAIARAEFSPVKDDHLEAALQLFGAALQTWQV